MGALTWILHPAIHLTTTFQRYRETGTLIDNLSYTYTAGTNRLASLTEAAGASAETWDAEAGSFAYDGNGNVKTSPAPYSVTATTYDARNLATAVTRAGVTTSYQYNEGGWRIAKQVGTGNQEHHGALHHRPRDSAPAPCARRRGGAGS